MFLNVTVQQVDARPIFDSRGMPTVEATVLLSNGISASASVPSGASTGKFEAHELRDGEQAYHGKGVNRAVEAVKKIIAPALQGRSIDRQDEIDACMMQLDGTDNKKKLGANGILAVSLAYAKACAKAHQLPLYAYLGGISGRVLPVPLMNVLNGGMHADNNVDIQEFMIMPVGAKSMEEAMRMGVEVYGQLGKCLQQENLSRTVGDEGGYAPNLGQDEDALRLLVTAITEAGYEPGKQVGIALDMAAGGWYQNGQYHLPKKNVTMDRNQMIDYIADLVDRYPILSVEDPLGEEDWEGFAMLTERLGHRLQIVGDDLFVTNPQRLEQGMKQKCGNAILIKPNQIGTLSQTLQCIRLARRGGYSVIISHRSGDTEDTTIADLAVAINAGQIKTGAPARSERVAKYNRLLKIEQMLGEKTPFSGFGTTV